MRWIFITLIIVNLSYLAWQLYDRKAEKPAPVRSHQPDRSGNLSMLSERTQKSLQELQAVVSNPIVQPSEEENTDGECLTIGSFPDIFAGRQVGNQLASLDIEAEVKAVDQVTGEYDYRVLIPPLNSLQESFRKLRELKARNIDSYVITAGENALGISLGVFSTESLAWQTRDRLEKDGYAVSLVEIPRLHREYWLFPAQGTELDVDDIWWQNLIRRYASIEKRRLPCE